MKFQLLALCLSSALLGSSAFAETKLMERTYKIRVQAGAFACTEPLLPNGHNYPVTTALTFTLQSYNLWGSAWTNVSDYSADVGYSPCKSFPRILRPAPEQDLIGVVTQKVTESYHLSGAPVRDCLRETREEAELVVDNVLFKGVNTFLVGPVDKKLCR